MNKKNKDNRILKNTVFQYICRILIIFLSFLTTAVLTRFLGSSDYGNYVFITSFILIFVAFSDLGTTSIAVREASTKKEETALIFGNVLGLRLGLSFFLFLIYIFFILYLPQFSGLRLATFLASFAVFFLTLRTTIQGVLQTYLRLDLSSYIEVFASLSFFLLIAITLFLKKGFSLPLLMFFWSISVFFSSGMAFFFSRRYSKIKPLISKKNFKNILKESVPLGAYFLVYSMYDKGIDSFILKTFTSSEAVGYYGLAYKFYGNLILGAAFLMNSLFPVLSSFKADLERIKAVFTKTFTVLFLGGFFISFGGLFFAPLAVRLVAGNNFNPSILVFRILLLATFFSYLNHLTGYLLVVLGKQKDLFYFSLMAFFFNLFLNLVLIPRYSFIAAAFVTVFTEMIMFFLTKHSLRRKFGLTYSPFDFKKQLMLIFKERLGYFNNFNE